MKDSISYPPQDSLKNATLSMWEEFPWSSVKKSSKVDILLFLLGIKPCVRSQFIPNNADLIVNWCHKFGLYIIIYSNYNFIFSYSKELNEEVFTTDIQKNQHEIKLGILLGYPLCCCNKIQNIGEKNIDSYETNFNYAHKNNGHPLLDISTYYDGIALISHVPCIAHCLNSIQIATKALSSLLQLINTLNFEELKWLYEITKKYSNVK
jgi:hypothetical protein